MTVVSVCDIAGSVITLMALYLFSKKDTICFVLNISANVCYLTKSLEKNPKGERASDD